MMTKLTLQEILQDLLSCEKLMLELYKQYTIEASNLELQDLCIQNMKDNFKSQFEVYKLMRDRKFYPVEYAEEQKIQQAIKMISQSTKNYENDF